MKKVLILNSLLFILAIINCSCSTAGEQNSGKSSNSPSSNTQTLNPPSSNTQTSNTETSNAQISNPPNSSMPTPSGTSTPFFLRMPPGQTPDGTTANTANSNSKITLTLTQFNKLKVGMDYAEAVKILGKEGVQVTNASTDNKKSGIYKWEGEKLVYVVLTFQDDKLTYKAQANLK